MIVWRRESRDPKHYGDINQPDRIGIYSGAVALDWRQARLSRFRSWATPPTCVRVRDCPILSNARIMRRVVISMMVSPLAGCSAILYRQPPDELGCSSLRGLRHYFFNAGFAYAPVRLFWAHSARAAPGAILFNRLKPFDRYRFADLVGRAAARRLISPLYTASITRLRKSCGYGLGIPRWPPQKATG
jgi:uncharacterized protein YceK